jgi:N4-gp56 family major capsid protein
VASNIQYNDVMTTAQLPDALRDIYSAELEYTALPMLVFDQFAEVKTEHGLERGDTAIWTIFRQLPATIGSLVENVDVDTQRAQDFQIQMTVDEYGNAIGTTKKLDLLSYFGPISTIVRGLLAPQMARTLDTLARNAAWAGAPKRFAGGAANRAALTAADVATVDAVKSAAHQLRINRIMTDGGSYICVAHPSVLYDLRDDPLWEDVGKYADAGRLATGEVGRLFGVRFVESDLARIPNGGASQVATTLTGAHDVGSLTLTMASTTGLNAGDEITLFAAAQTIPDGTGVTEEPVIIQSVTNGTQVALEHSTLVAHQNADKVRLGLDIFPMMFMGAEKAYGKSVVASPSVVVALPTDKLRRMNYVGWYGLLGYGTLRDWAYLVLETAASQDSKYIFGT